MRADGAGSSMPEVLSAYRIFDRKKFVVIMAVLLSVVGVWVGLDRVVGELLLRAQKQAIDRSCAR